MNKDLRKKLLESYIKEVIDKNQQVKHLHVQHEDVSQSSPEQEQLKTQALDTAKEFSDLNKNLMSIKSSYDQNAKTDLKRFVQEIFGDPYANLSKMCQIGYEISENIVLKLKISNDQQISSYQNLIQELIKLLPEAKKIIEELVAKYTELKGVDSNIEGQVVNEDFAQTFKNLLSGTKNWAIKFNYKTEYLKGKIEQLYYKFKNPKLFYKE